MESKLIKLTVSVCKNGNYQNSYSYYFKDQKIVDELEKIAKEFKNKERDLC